jgi:phosphate transport system substrate-binding protein
MLVSGPVLAEETVRIGGTGGALEVVRLASEQMRLTEGVRTEVLPSLGSTGALRAVATGAIEVAISARPLTAEEVASGLREVLFARTPLVFVSSRSAPDAMTNAELVSAFGAKDPRWPDGSAIHLILRPRSDFDTQLIARSFPGMSTAIEAARRRADLPTAATDQDSAELAERLPGSLVQAGYGQIIAEKRALRFIAVDGVHPSLETLSDGRYRHQKTFYVVYHVERSGPADRLIAFVRSRAGSAMLRENGYLAVE